MLIGYARCSTADQNLDWQLDALTKNGCERIYREKVTGTWRKASLPFHGPEVIVLLASDHEVGSDGFYRIKPFEVVVAAIEDVERVLFVWNGILR